MLHTVNKSPFMNQSLESCLRFTQSGDAILLIEDGVYGAAAGTGKSALVEEALKNHQVYVLSADLKARALTNLIEGVKVTDYAGFVDLVEQNLVHAWL
ncbi:MAG: sulfurtransferase complex subunit TusB [Magnetococcales bacterium]|nr:sulfurtransferase complex subunit TusB [Magnetococcales bacterium]